MKRKIDIDKTINEIQSIPTHLNLELVKSWVWSYDPTNKPALINTAKFNWKYIFKSRIN